ncbi:MAG: hypothetical protein ACYSYU_11745, partial [Planctomycetota bacterium]
MDGADKIYILDATDSALKPVDIDLVAQHAIDTVWGKALEASPDAADIMALKDGGTTEKTITLPVLAEYVRSVIEAAILDVSDLVERTPAASDYMLIVDGTTAKQCTFSDLNAAIYASLDTHIIGLGAIAATGDTDLFYTLAGGTTPKKVTLVEDNLILGAGASSVKDGPVLIDGAIGAGASLVVPSTLCLRSNMDTIIFDEVDIGAALVDADTILVDDGGAGTTQRKSQLSRLWTYILGNIALVADVSTWGFVLDQDTMSGNDATKLATQQSIKAYVDAQASAWDGDITDADIVGGADIGEDLADGDLAIVYNLSGTANVKSTILRI